MSEPPKPISKITCDNVGLVGSLTMQSGTDDFTLHNLLYGRNGSGKTVFSSVMWLVSSMTEPDIKLALERRLKKDESKNIAVSLVSSGNTKTKVSSVPIYTFNTEFIAQHVYDGSQTKLKEFDQSVVTAGHLQNPKIKNVEDEIEDLKTSLAVHEEERVRLEELAKNIKEQLSKELNAKIPGERMPSLPLPESLLLAAPAGTLGEIRAELDEHFDKYEKTKNQEMIKVDKESIAAEFATISKEPFSSLEETLKLNVTTKSAELEGKIKDWRELQLKHHSPQDWLEDGKNLLVSNRSARKCPLCNTLLDKMDEIIEEYENFFSNEAEELLSKLENLETALSASLAKLSSYADNEKVLLALESKYLKTKDVISTEKKKKLDFATSDSALSDAIALVVKKKKDIGYKVTGEEITKVQALPEAIDSFNKELLVLEKKRSALASHLDDLTFDKSAFKGTLKKMFLIRFDEEAEVNTFFETHELEQPSEINGGLSFYAYLDSERKGTNNKINAKGIERNQLLATLKQESKLVNEYLKKLSIHSFDVNFGRADEDIEITYKLGVVKQGVNNCLSDGEKSALAFAYFLSKIRHEVVDNKNSTNSLNNCVIVIDDPVSSLDEDRLFSTALVIRDEFCEKVSQLFVLSHNLVFLRLFGNIIKGNSKTRKDYIVAESVISNRPASLRNFHTSYFYKYQKIIDFSDGKIAYDSAKDFLPNYIRTVLETFLSFKFYRLHSSKNSFESPGLPQLIEVVKANIGLMPASSANSISKTNVIEELEHINRKVDPESHGTPQDLTDFEYMAEGELETMSKNALEIIEYIDGIHSKEVTGK
jgi:wobble nucleotide-excising tRNase